MQQMPGGTVPVIMVIRLGHLGAPRNSMVPRDLVLICSTYDGGGDPRRGDEFRKLI